MPVSMNKRYTTRDGLPVRILCINRESEFIKYCVNKYCVVCLVKNKETGYEDLGTRTIDGLVYTDRMSSGDLVEYAPWLEFEIDTPVLFKFSELSPWVIGKYAGTFSDDDNKPTVWVTVTNTHPGECFISGDSKTTHATVAVYECKRIPQPVFK